MLIKNHKLKLKDGIWPKGKSFETVKDQRVQRVYTSLVNPQFRWKKMATIVQAAEISEEEARTILHTLESEGIVRQADFSTPDQQTLWGATATVGLPPRIFPEAK